MTINLKKGQTINLSKSEYNLSKLTLALGWDVRKSKSLLGGLFGGAKADFDLDSYALLLTEKGKLSDYKGDVIYYGHLASKDQTVVHLGDNLTGAGEGDDEIMFLELDKIPTKYHKVLLGVSIYKAQEREQHFGMVNNAFVRAVDANGKEIARYSLSNDSSYEGKISMLMGEVFRHGNDWDFKALGNPMLQDLNGVVKSFM